MRVQDAHAGAASLVSITSARKVKAVTDTAIPSAQPPRNARPFIRARGVNSSSTAGMIGNGEAAIATAEASPSATLGSLVWRTFSGVSYLQ